MQAPQDAIFIVALVTAGAYARWHFWWRSGFGRSRMCLLLSLAALTIEPAAQHWARPHTLPGHILRVTGYAATVGVLISLLYMLYRITWANIHRARYPGDAAEQGRRHIQRTPGAGQPEIGKMLACWDEARGLTPPHPSSQTTRRRKPPA